MGSSGSWRMGTTSLIRHGSPLGGSSSTRWSTTPNESTSTERHTDMANKTLKDVLVAFGEFMEGKGSCYVKEHPHDGFDELTNEQMTQAFLDQWDDNWE